MTDELVTVDEDASLEAVVTLMEQHRIKRVPVLHDGRLVGLVSRADLLRLLLPCLTVSESELRTTRSAAGSSRRWPASAGRRAKACGSAARMASSRWTA